MGAPRTPVLQTCEVVGDLSRRPHLPPRAARAAHRHLTTPEIVVAAFNAHWGIGRFGAFEGARYDAARVVRTFDADVVVVAESWREHSGRGLLDLLVDDGYAIENVEFATLEISGDRPRFADPGEGRWELAICSRLPVVARRVLPIGRIGADPAGARSALSCTIDVGVAVEVIAVHASSKLYKLAPLRHLLALRRQLPPPGAPTVIAGDCNFWGPPVGVLLPGWRRAVRGRTYPAHRPHSQVDHVLVRGAVDVVEGEVLAATPSDHRPVRARLRIGTRVT